MSKAPLPANEAARLLSLHDLDLDYKGLENDFKDLVLLVSKITGMDVSLVNLLDTFNQWTIASHGIPVESMPREDSVCQYTILQDEPLEVKDLSLDVNHKDKFYVTGAPHFRYYFGIPLTTSKGVNIGSLCVLDREPKQLSPEQVDYLKIIADEVVNKLKAHKTITKLREDINGTLKEQKRVAVELRDSLAGIVGISDVLMDPEIPYGADEAKGFVSLINERGKSMLELTREFIEDKEEEADVSGITLAELRDKLSSFYRPLLSGKEQSLDITVNSLKNHILFSRSRVIAALNYPVSGAIYLSPKGSVISVALDIDVQADSYTLTALVKSDSVVSHDGKQLILPGHFNGDFKCSADNEAFQYEMSLPVDVI